MLQSYFSLKCSSKTLLLQFVRYRRKPRWLPTAPSKIFRVPKRLKLPSEEAVEWLRINQNYKTQYQSFRQYLMNENIKKNAQESFYSTPADELAEFEKCNKINDEWNRDVLHNRSLRLIKETDKHKNKILQRIDQEHRKEKVFKQKINDKVMEAEELVKTFITEDKLLQSIEIALSNPKSFLNAINSKGEKISKK